MRTDPSVIYLADHSVVLAIPAVLPALIIVAVIVYIVVRDRRKEREENEQAALFEDER